MDYYILIVFAIMLWILHSRKHQHLPPGPFKLPWIGNLPQILCTDRAFPHKALSKMAQTFGPVIHIQWGVHPMVVVSSYRIMQDIHSKREASGSPVLPCCSKKGRLGLIWNENWYPQRSFIIKTAKEYSFGRSNSMDVLLQEEVVDFVSDLRAKIKESDGIWTMDDTEFTKISVNIIWSFISGRKLSDTGMLNKLALACQDIQDALKYTNWCTTFPVLKRLCPKWSGWDAHEKAYTTMHNCIQELIDQNRRCKSDFDSSCIMDEFLEHCATGQNFSERHLIPVIQDLFLFGSTSIARCLSWIILHLSLNPDVQDKVFDELSIVIGGNQPIYPEQMDSLPYTTAAMYEALRVANPMPLPFPRCATKDFTVGGYSVPKGTAIMYNLDAILKNRNIFPDPEMFRPERFLTPDQMQINPYLKEMIRCIFGQGRRSCVAESLSWNTLFLYMTSIVQKFKFKLDGKTPNVLPGYVLSPGTFSLHVGVR